MGSRRQAGAPGATRAQHAGDRAGHDPGRAVGDDRLLGHDVEEAVRQEYLAGAKALDRLIDDMKEASGPALRAQAMYWCGIAYRKAESLPEAYLRIKRVTFEYPDTKWARMARGLLYQDEALADQAETRSP